MWWPFLRRSRDPISGSFEAMSGRAERLAERVARSYGHEYVGTEHFLLALLLPPANPASVLLARCGMAPDEVVRTVERFILRGPGLAPWGRLPQTPAARRALEAARQEAAKVSPPAGAVAVLMGLAHDQLGFSGAILYSLGAGEQALHTAAELGQREAGPG